VAGGLLHHATRDTRHASLPTLPPPLPERNGSEVEGPSSVLEDSSTPPTVVGRNEVIAPPLPKVQEKTNELLETQDERRKTQDMTGQVPSDLTSYVLHPAIELNTVRMKWPAIIRAVDEINHSLPFILKISKPESIMGNTVIVRFQYGFHRDKLVGDPKNRRTVEEAMRQVLGVPTLSLDGIVGEDVAVAEERPKDMVGDLLKAFGGSVVEP